ncbi:uncharacterized protein LOC126576562 [Anopheles aquasalis]|uniref:uncharacterized protein LOC126576562 n=1 Tax=Anopheles aquasalis TaxID=42839 RepID=UPI00215A3117|nr:uncharacterized protein LOC126576562 [Anopheles aquasalis]
MHFKKSNKATQKLVEIQENLNFNTLKLKQDSITRWNSTYDMLERFFKNKVPLVSCIAKRKTIYPALSTFAQKYLSVPATSVPCERIFSKAGQIMTERRRRQLMDDNIYKDP